MIIMGGINLANALLDAERRIIMLEMAMDKVMQYVPSGVITQADLAAMNERAVAELQKKYPEAGIQWTPGKPAA